MHLYLIRHGETNYEARGLVNDDPSIDVHLTDEGKEQAQNAAKQLEDIDFDRVIISEFPSTKETAEILVPDYSGSFEVDPRINDRKTGFEGESADDFQSAVADDRLNTKPEGGESFLEEKERVKKFYTELVENDADNVLVVAHEEPLQIIAGLFYELPDEKTLEIIIANCQIDQLDI